jgi:hypothetical protein
MKYGINLHKNNCRIIIIIIIVLAMWILKVLLIMINYIDNKLTLH